MPEALLPRREVFGSLPNDGHTHSGNIRKPYRLHEEPCCWLIVHVALQ